MRDEDNVVARESVSSVEDALSRPVEMPIEWTEHIESRPGVLSGKPVIRGTRISAAFLLSLYAAGWSEEDVLDSYPSLTSENLRAVFAWASERLSQESQSVVAR